MSEAEQPIILCGLGRMGMRVLDYLGAAGFPVVVIDKAARTVTGAAAVTFIQGDCRQREVLEKAGVANARGVLILTSDDLVNIATTLTARALSPGVRIVVRLFNQNLMDRLGDTIRNVYALSTSRLTAPILAMTALTGQGLGSFRLHEGPDGWYQVAELRVRAGSSLLGKSLAAVASRSHIQVLGHARLGKPFSLLLEVDPETRLESGDHVVVCGPPSDLAPLLHADDAESLPHLRWAGWLRRQLRAVWRTLAEMDRAVALCTAVLVLIVLGSTLILRFGVRKYTLPDALFRTISIMATISGMHEEDYDTGGMKIFVSVLRIVGAALMAAFTAIVTNYLLRARLGGALEIRRIPEGGHFVVCGLSPVGFRVTEELVRAGERVVAVDLAPDTRFAATARRLGAAVIQGDATVAEVLRQAHADTARAVVAATNKDLVNLEMALLVRDMNPAQRIILLQADPQLALLLREAADVRLAVSVPALAAPAFVAALFGDRILSVFFVGERLLAALDLLVQEDDTLLTGSSLRALAVDFHFVPISVVSPGRNGSAPLLAHRLERGDRLVAILAVADLQRLLSRRPPERKHTVEVLSCPLPTRAWLAGLLRTTLTLSAEEAEAVVAGLPYCLPCRLSHGEAEDMLARLVRERVPARLLIHPGQTVT